MRGRVPVGERLYSSVLFGKGRAQTFIAGLTSDALIAGPGYLNGAAFDTCIETQLAPLLEPGSIVIDNLSTHKSPRSAAALKQRGCWFLFLPPYNPDPNPIELAFSKLKAHLRRIGARTYDELIAAIGNICNLYQPNECSNFFKVTGYTSD
ncbi:MAG: transposase [Pseudomonadota bacterium]